MTHGIGLIMDLFIAGFIHVFPQSFSLFQRDMFGKDGEPHRNHSRCAVLIINNFTCGIQFGACRSEFGFQFCGIFAELTGQFCGHLFAFFRCFDVGGVNHQRNAWHISHQQIPGHIVDFAPFAYGFATAGIFAGGLCSKFLAPEDLQMYQPADHSDCQRDQHCCNNAHADTDGVITAFHELVTGIAEIRIA